MENLEFKLKKFPDLIPGIGLITNTIRNEKIREANGKEKNLLYSLNPKYVAFMAYQTYSMMFAGFSIYLLIRYIK